MTHTRTAYASGLALAVFTALFLLWAVGALGVIGEGGEPDRMYAGVLAVGLVGAAVVRLRARGMMWVLLAQAAAMVLVAVIALAAGLHDTPGASVVEILGLTGMYVALFSTAAWLFHRADETASPVSHPS